MTLPISVFEAAVTAAQQELESVSPCVHLAICLSCQNRVRPAVRAAFEQAGFSIEDPVKDQEGTMNEPQHPRFAGHMTVVSEQHEYQVQVRAYDTPEYWKHVDATVRVGGHAPTTITFGKVTFMIDQLEQIAADLRMIEGTDPDQT